MNSIKKKYLIWMWEKNNKRVYKVKRSMKKTNR